MNAKSKMKVLHEDTLIFLCIDQREKNAFPTYIADMAKWIWLFYDADSSIGTDNKFTAAACNNGDWKILSDDFNTEQEAIAWVNEKVKATA